MHYLWLHGDHYIGEGGDRYLGRLFLGEHFLDDLSGYAALTRPTISSHSITLTVDRVSAA